ncbi:MAG: hypothetical protein ACUVWV_03930 [Thermodesulfobacteriota bacterium]
MVVLKKSTVQTQHVYSPVKYVGEIIGPYCRGAREIPGRKLIDEDEDEGINKPAINHP